MSLYADDDIGAPLTYQDEQLDLKSAVGSTSTSSSTSPPTDPLQALHAALALDPESPAQQDGLTAAAARFELNPERLPELVPQLLGLISEGGDSMLRFWTLDMIALAVGRSGLKVDIKIGVAQQCLDALVKLLHGTSIPTIKAIIPIFSTIYPLLFRLMATSRPPQSIIDLFRAFKSRILAFALDPNVQPQNVGVKAAAWKFLQKVLLAATRAASTDPRLQNRAATNDVSASIITPGSALSAMEVEEEGTLLRTQLVTQLYSIHDPAILHAIINILPVLCKSRPSLAPLLVSSMTSWTPAALQASGRHSMEIRAVEKTMRMVMTHILRHPPFAAFAAQLNDALVRQKQRMEHEYVLESQARKERRRAVKQPIKHPLEAESSEQGAKRARLEVFAGSGLGRGPAFDVSILPPEAVIDAVMTGLEVVSVELMQRAFDNARRAIAEETPNAIPLLAQALGLLKEEIKEEEDDEVLNPLDMDLDDDEDLLLDQYDEPPEDDIITFADFTLPPPEPLGKAEVDDVMEGAMERIWISGGDLATLPDPKESDGVKSAVQPKEMWMLLLARLATRGAEVKRKAICDFITADFVNRSKFASVWLNEEWYNEKIGAGGQYAMNLEAVVSAFLPSLDAKDKTFASFLATLPEIPPSIIAMLETLCQDSERNRVGLIALRDLVESRPPARQLALQTLLQLCTHDDRKIRITAIISVGRWVPDSPMASTLIFYALGVLQRLEKKDKSDDVDMDGGDTKEVIVQSKYLGKVTPDTVPQHVELAFALARRQQTLLDDIFQLYPKLDPEIQDTVETLFMPLVESLIHIKSTDKLLSILRTFPEGSDKLVMRVINTLSAKGASPALAQVIKGLLGERELDPKFVIPILGELDKDEIAKQLPRIVGMLSESENKDTVKTAFAAVLQKLTPADLFVVLHQDESQLKLTMEAIGMCFSMTTVFRSDVLANAMQRIADLPSLPIISFRTIIQVTTTYKSLIPFVANHVLPKLISKKIWDIPEKPQLWEGFVKLSKVIAPASFGAMLQLPKPQLRDLLGKQPVLKAGLKAFLASKPASKVAMQEIFGDDA